MQDPFRNPHADPALAEAIARIREEHATVMANIGKVILGKDDVVHKVITAMAARGHVLLLDVPGVGKTMLARTIAATIHCGFKRIQFTPDLLPIDITGSNIFNMRMKSFEFQQGPVFTNILLGDEINRATPKTQSSLLEVMAERQVTVEGTTHDIEPPFQVLATMNPLEHDGTYPLPAAQLDRFMIRTTMGYPDQEAEMRILDVHLQVRPPVESLEPVVSQEDFLRWQHTVPSIYCAQRLKRYVVDLVTHIRSDPGALQTVSPRATLMLVAMAQAHAMLAGRDFVSADDVQAVAADVLSHRLVLAGDRVGAAFIQDAISAVPVRD
jgi:MoxR-like ATPase